MLFQLVINGLQVGALYALTAVGFALIYGSTRIFHFAHGATLMIAAYTFYFLYSTLSVHWIGAAAMATVAALVFGILVYVAVYRPIQQHIGSFFTVFVAALGVGIIAQNLIGIAFGRSFVSSSTPLSRTIDMGGGLLLSPLSAIAIGCAICTFAALHFFLSRSNHGLALRALSENPELVSTYGLSRHQISVTAFALGSVLAVPAAIILAASSGLNPAMGSHVMLISLTATIVGGVGSLRGAACAGVLLGLAESLSLLYFEAQWSEAVTFIVLLLFILLRPAGFFGRAVVS